MIDPFTLHPLQSEFSKCGENVRMNVMIRHRDEAYDNKRRQLATLLSESAATAPPTPAKLFIYLPIAGGFEAVRRSGLDSSRLPSFYLKMTRTKEGHLSSHLKPYNEHKQGLTSSSSMDTDWKSATCAICMEPPHNAILLLCSSHEKGCRPYMCDTSYQHSNCLELFKKAYTASISFNPKPFPPLTSAICDESKSSELPCPQCPLCRTQVKGWTVIRSARKYLNNKRRSCMQGNCSFVGTFMELQKHITEDHPFSRPQEVDAELEKKWREFELEGERQDVISLISSSMPNSLILGDYVIDREDLHNNIVHSVFYSAEDRINRIFNDLFYDDDANVRRVHRRLRRRRQRRLRGRWMLGFRPFLGRWGWMYH